MRAARIAAGYGARVMLAEEYRLGGTCVIRGCVPKKLLVYAARFADEFEDAAGYRLDRAGADLRLEDADRQQGSRDRPARGRLRDHAGARQGHAVQGPRGGRGRADGAGRQRRNAPRQAYPDRHRRRSLCGRRYRGARARHLLERGVPPGRVAEAHSDPGRRLHRGRVRRHLQRARLAGDAGLSRGEHSARLRRRRARASALGNGAARHQDHHPADRHRRREGRARLLRRAIRP